MKLEKFESIVNNYVNGNLSDFRKQIKKLSKAELIEFCIEYFDVYMLDRDQTKNLFRSIWLNLKAD